MAEEVSLSLLTAKLLLSLLPRLCFFGRVKRSKHRRLLISVRFSCSDGPWMSSAQPKVTAAQHLIRPPYR
jgi:hypothetical protein